MDDMGLGDFPIESPDWVVTFQGDAPTAKDKEIADFMQYLLKQTMADALQNVITEMFNAIRTGQLNSMRLFKENGRPGTSGSA